VRITHIVESLQLGYGVPKDQSLDAVTILREESFMK
jgi:hypothetical protein